MPLDAGTDPDTSVSAGGIDAMAASSVTYSLSSAFVCSSEVNGRDLGSLKGWL